MPETHSTQNTTLNSITVVIADDHPIVLAGYTHLLEAEPQIKVLAQATSAQAALESCRLHNPDILILDLGLPSRASDTQTHALSGIEVVKELRAKHSSTRVLVASMLDKTPIPQRVLQAGASGYLVKSEAADELLIAIRKVAKGESYVSPAIEAELKSEPNALDRIGDLSKRELEIFTLLAEGLPAVQIAEKTNLSPKTVHAHRANILRKLGLKNNSDLVRYALSTGSITQ